MAAVFQVLLRIPEAALEAILKQVVKRIYVEPRASQVRGPHPDFGVIWLKGADREQALHKLRTCTFGLSLTRLSHRYGIRVTKVNEPKAHKELKPDETYINVEIRQIYTLFPLPHGLSRAQIAQLLENWNWVARPLQPTRGTTMGQTWTVGSHSPPPQPVLNGFERDILITLQKEAAPVEAHQGLIASQRTKKFLKDGHTNSDQATGSADPWHNGSDPWQQWMPSSTPGTKVVQTSRMEKLQETIKEEVQKHVQQVPPGLAPPDDLQKMQVSITELQAQGQQFQTWFHEAGTRMNQTEGQLNQLKQIVEKQGQQLQHHITEVHSEMDNRTQLLQSTISGSMASISSDLNHTLDAKLESQFERLEALIHKSRRTE